MSRFPSTDKQCSVRDAVDVLTPEEEKEDGCVKWAWLAKGTKGKPTSLGAALAELHIIGDLWQ